jgi:hypothetical protein
MERRKRNELVKSLSIILEEIEEFSVSSGITRG